VGAAYGFYYFLVNTGNYNNEALFEKYYKPYSNYWTQSASNDTNRLEYVAMKYYDLKDYHLAVESFHRFEPEKKDDGYYNLYLGISYLQTGFENLAETHIYTAMDSFKEFNNIYTAKWYLALAYLKSSRVNECKKLLNEIINVNAPYKTKAKDLLDELS
jgi:hypothetical protein